MKKYFLILIIPLILCGCEKSKAYTGSEDNSSNKTTTRSTFVTIGEYVETTTTSTSAISTTTKATTTTKPTTINNSTSATSTTTKATTTTKKEEIVTKKYNTFKVVAKNEDSKYSYNLAQAYTFEVTLTGKKSLVEKINEPVLYIDVKNLKTGLNENVKVNADVDSSIKYEITPSSIEVYVFNRASTSPIPYIYFGKFRNMDQIKQFEKEYNVTIEVIEGVKCGYLEGGKEQIIPGKTYHYYVVSIDPFIDGACGDAVE